MVWYGTFFFSVFDLVNWLQAFTGLASIRILNAVICGIIYVFLFAFGAYYWQNVDSETSKMYNTEQALRFVKK
jgi:hypothetical protein